MFQEPVIALIPLKKKSMILVEDLMLKFVVDMNLRAKLVSLVNSF